MKSVAVTALLLLLLVPLASVSAQSAEPDGAPSEEEDAELEALLGESVVTTASRGAEVASAAPATVFTITAREIHTFGIRTVDEALSFLGIGMYILRPRDYFTGIDVGAQGLIQRDGGRHVLVMVDGHVMNSQDTGTVTIHEGLGVPLEAIDHIEVMLGAGSVVYGSNAMIAVINVITAGVDRGTHVHAVAELGIAPPTGEDGQPTTPDRPGDRVGLRYRLGLGLSSAFEVFGSPAQLTIRAEWLEDISNSYRIQPLTDNVDLRPGETSWGGGTTHSLQAPSVVAALRIGDFQLRIMANQYTRGIPLVGTFSDPASREQREALRGDLRHSASLSAEVNLSTRLYADYTRFAESTNWRNIIWCVDGQIDGCRFQLGSAGRWAGLEQVLTIDWTLDSRFTTTVGYDVRGRDATSRPADYLDYLTGAPPYSQPAPYIHQVTVLGAVFLQQVIRPIEWLTFNLGGRLDVDSQFGTRISPRAAALVTPIEGTSVRASYSEAFRTPTSYELGAWDPTYQVAALGLRPEVVRTGELEWQQRIEWLTFSLRGFVAFYEDFIGSRSATEEEVSAAAARGQVSGSADPTLFIRDDNLQSLRSFGGSLSLVLRPTTGLQIAGSLTVADTRDGDSPIALAPLWSGNARISYEVSPNGASVALAAVFAGPRIAFEDLGASSLHSVGEQLDLRLTVASPIDLVPGLRFRASLGYTVNPALPYLIAAPTEDYPDSPVVFQRATSSLLGFLGLQYDLDV